VDDDDEVFLRLGDLIFRTKVVPGTLATAIEMHGVHTWDRYGRRRLFLPDSAEAKQALDAIARYYSSLGGHPDDIIDGEDFYDMGGDIFGWPAEQSPNFDELQATIRTDPKPHRPPHAVEKSENANIGIIGGLLQYIKGELGNQKHPEFRSEDALIEHLELKLKGYAGLSKRNLKDKFALGKAALKS
jgi:hypothetical protein